MVFSLCAIVSTVQSSNWVLIVIWIRSSVSRSIAAVASSRIKTLVLRSSALARQTSCLWPTLQAETRLSQRPCCPAAPTVHNHLSSTDAVTQPKKKRGISQTGCQPQSKGMLTAALQHYSAPACLHFLPGQSHQTSPFCHYVKNQGSQQWQCFCPSPGGHTQL